METKRKPYPSDASDEEWAFVAPYLTLMTVDAPQRAHDLREVFNAVRYLVRAGCSWRMLPNDLPPWAAVSQQTQRWLAAGSFEAIVHDLRMLVRLANGRTAQPSAAIVDGRTMQSTPESGARAGYDGHKRKKGSKVHMAVDTLGHLLALHVTPANEQERAQVETLAKAVQEVTDDHIELARVDHGYTGEEPAQAAREHGINPGGGEAAGGQARLRAAAAALGGRAQLRLGDAVQTPGEGLRAAGHHSVPELRVRIPETIARSSSPSTMLR